MRCRRILRPCYRGTELLVILVVLELRFAVPGTSFLQAIGEETG
jgi:hypothetical protein